MPRVIVKRRLPTRPVCPNNDCRKLLDGTVVAENQSLVPDAPEEGDFTICVYCGEAARFTKELSLRSVTKVDLMYVPKDFWSAYAETAPRRKKGSIQ